MVLNLYVHAAFQVDIVYPSIYSNFMNHLMIHDSGILETRQFSTFRSAKPTFCLLSRLKDTFSVIHFPALSLRLLTPFMVNLLRLLS